MRTRWKVLLGLLLLLAIVLYVVYIKVVLGDASAADDIVIQSWSTEDIQDIPVALDVSLEGHVYVAETGQFTKGVGDNRYQPFWFMDDMASTSLDDRLAYIEKALANGDLSEEWFDQQDTLRVIRDTDQDGVADSATVFTQTSGYLDGLMSGVLATDDGVLVSNIPNLYRFKDTDGDFKADSTEILSTGYGIRTAFVGHDLHGLTWGPDGKIYFSVGDRGFNVTTAEGVNLQAPLDQGRGAVFRMNPDGSEQELYAWGLRNPQELAFDNYGNLITGDNNSDGGDQARIVYVVEGGDSGWTYGFQYMAESDYLRGPWNAERMWEPYHEGQPAWIVPPLANETNGPSGVAFYPGLGLPERYNNHFFISNYSFIGAGSWILSFSIEPRGAGFELRNVHKFSDGDLFIDQAFGYDGKMYAITASVFGGEKKVITLYGKNEQKDPRIQQTRELLLAGLASKSSAELSELLSHADQRLRLKAQFELAERAAISELTELSMSASAPELGRIHALWGLGQIGAPGFAQWQNFDSFEGEVLAQAIKMAGEGAAVNLAAEVRKFIGHENARVSYFAMMSAGKLGDDQAINAIIDALRRNNNADAFLRHAGVWALAEINDVPALERFSASDSPAIRLASLLVARRHQSDLLAKFLADDDISLVVEAARAIHDLRLQSSLPALAAMADKEMPITSDEPQTSFALHRRVINANLLLGHEDNAVSLASYAARESNPLRMRTLALETLQQFVEPPLLDIVWGDHMPLSKRESSVVHAALDKYVPLMLDGELGDLALETALGYERVPLSTHELVLLITDAEASSLQRLAALNALHKQREQPEAAAVYKSSLESALDSNDAPLRSRALQLLAAHNPSRATQLAVSIASERHTESNNDIGLTERQAAIALLGEFSSELATDFLTTSLTALSAGTLAPAIQLDIVQAAENNAVNEVKLALDAYRQEIGPNPIAQRRIAMFGGNPVNGKSVFENLGDCLRCHSVEQKGGVAGPALDGVAKKFDTEYLYRALVDPAADMAEGFASVSLKLQDGTSMSGIMLNESADVVRMQVDSGHGDVSSVEIPVETIADKQGPFSGMPAMGLVVRRSDLRDLMAYLGTLQ